MLMNFFLLDYEYCQLDTARLRTRFTFLALFFPFPSLLLYHAFVTVCMDH